MAARRGEAPRRDRGDFENARPRETVRRESRPRDENPLSRRRELPADQAVLIEVMNTVMRP